MSVCQAITSWHVWVSDESDPDDCAWPIVVTAPDAATARSMVRLPGMMIVDVLPLVGMEREPYGLFS